MAVRPPPTKKAGRPIPQRITVTLAQQHAEELVRLAHEANVTPAAFCANVLERYAVQDRELMTNDLIATRLEAITTQHAQQFAQRFGDVVLRMAHETTALRRQYNADAAQRIGAEAAKKAADDAWGRAVQSLRPYSQRVRGDQGDEAQP